MDPTEVHLDSPDQFWRASSIDFDYWQKYLQARPKYHKNGFYTLLLDYHRSHRRMKSPTIAHDIATGPGQVAAILGQHFDQVVASDLNSTHLKVAENLLASNGKNRNVTFHNVGAEDITKHFPQSSTDLITAAECMPLIDADGAISAWANLLKPDGTLAMWFYGRPAFADESGFDAAACNAMYETLVTKAFRPFYEVTGPRLMGVRRGMDGMVSWLDNVDLNPEIWTDVRRLKWNTHLPMEFSHAEDLGWPRNHINNIHEGEKIETMSDQDLWSEMWDIEDWKTFSSVLLPSFNRGWNNEMQTMWAELEAKAGSKVKRKVIWPVVAVFATRRGDQGASI